MPIYLITGTTKHTKVVDFNKVIRFDEHLYKNTFYKYKWYVEAKNSIDIDELASKVERYYQNITIVVVPHVPENVKVISYNKLHEFFENVRTYDQKILDLKIQIHNLQSKMRQQEGFMKDYVDTNLPLCNKTATFEQIGTNVTS